MRKKLLVIAADRCRAEPPLMEQPGGRASTLARAVDDHHGRSEVKALPDMGCALRLAETTRNGKTPSVAAGQCLCGAPRRNRTGDPILTIPVAAHL